MEGHSRFLQRPEKLTEAVIYLCQRSSDDPDFGETKLVKLLYYADCDTYERSGQPITGSTYLHFQHGPYPDNWNEIKGRMETRGDIAVIREVTPGGYERKRTVARRLFNPTVLSWEETAALDRQLEQFAGFNASDIVAHSHRGLGWRATKHLEQIPYQASRFSAPEKDDDLSREAQRIADEESRRRANL
jgi:uncharacterized phage-associated protein